LKHDGPEELKAVSNSCFHQEIYKHYLRKYFLQFAIFDHFFKYSDYCAFQVNEDGPYLNDEYQYSKTYLA